MYMYMYILLSERKKKQWSILYYVDVVYFIENLVDFVKIVLRGNILWTQIISFAFLKFMHIFLFLETIVRVSFWKNFSIYANIV